MCICDASPPRSCQVSGIEGILIPNAGGRDFIGTRAGVQMLPELRGALFAEPAVRLTDYNYDPSFGNPIGRVFKLAVSKQFR